MGSGEKIAPLPLRSHTEIFEEHFPYYLAIGMTYEQFWEQNSSLVIFYRKANQLKLQQQNTMLWLQGQYFYDALGAISPILHAFAKQGTKPGKYTQKPYPITDSDRKLEAERQAKAKRDAFKASLMAFADQWEQDKKGGGEP